MNASASEGAASGSDGPDAATAGAEAATGYGPPPDSVVLPGYPSSPPSPGRRKAAAIAAAGAAIAILVGVLVFAFVSHLNSTANVRVIVPAPAAAGGLNQDYADEGSSQFQAAISALHQRFAAAVHGGTFAAAIYTNAPAGSSARSASFVLVYLGFNAPSADDPAGAVKSALSGIGSQLSHVTMLQEGGGSGDTRFACETGTSAQSPVVVCGWGTDRTVGLLIPQTPGADPGKLAALMKKMEPDLVRG
jgi:hypothetical protein